MGDRIPGGYYLKARVVKDKPVHRMPPYVREIWDYCLREASHKDIQYGPHWTKRGQLFRTYKQIRQDLCWYIGYRRVMYSDNEVKKAMKALRDNDMIQTTKAPGGVLVTVRNYCFYQDSKNYESTKTPHESTNESTNESTSDGTNESTRDTTNKDLQQQGIDDNSETHESTTKEPVKAPRKHHDRSDNNKNVKNVKKKETTFSEETPEMKISKLLFSFLVHRNPGTKEPSFQSWAKDADLLFRVDKRPYDEAAALIEWCQNDSFWCSNIRCMSKFRQQYDQLADKMNTSTTSKPKANILEFADFQSAVSQFKPALMAGEKPVHSDRAINFVFQRYSGDTIFENMDYIYKTAYIPEAQSA